MSQGIFYNLIARSLFILGAYIIHVSVGRRFGLDLYGTFGVSLAILTISYIFLDNGVRQAISRLIALHPESAKGIFRKGFWVQLVISLPIAMAVFGFSGKIATFFNDTHLSVPLQICGIIILVQAQFFISMGTMNGQKRFLSESFVISIYSIIRPAAVLLFVWKGFGVVGAVSGYLFASVCAAFIGIMMLLGVPDRPIRLKIKDVFQSAAMNIIIFGSMAVLMNIDLLLVKRFLGDGKCTGLYTAASAFSKPPCLLLFTFGAIGLPLIARSYGNSNIAQCKIYFSQIVRYSIIIFTPVISLIAVTSTELVISFYNPEYISAGLALRVLTVGLWFIGNAYILAHVMIAIGSEHFMAMFSVITIILDVLFNLLFIPKFGINGAAFATTLSAFMLLIACGCYVTIKIGLEITVKTILRLTFLLFIISYIPGLLPLDKIPLLVQYTILYALYAAGLFMTGEINMEDRVMLKQLIEQKVTTE